MPNEDQKKAAKSIKKAFDEGSGVWEKIKDFSAFAMRGKPLKERLTDSLSKSLKDKEKTDKGK